MSSAYAYIAIIDPPGGLTAVTDRMGISPTKLKKRGERFPHGTMVHKSDCWILESPTGRSDCDLDHHVRDLLALVESRKKEIRLLADQSYARLTLVGYFAHANEEFQLTRQQLALIVEMGLEVTYDVYFVGEKSGPNPESSVSAQPETGHLLNKPMRNGDR